MEDSVNNHNPWKSGVSLTFIPPQHLFLSSPAALGADGKGLDGVAGCEVSPSLVS